MIRSLVRELSPTECLASLYLGEPQRALLLYYAAITTRRLELHQDADCSVMLVQGLRDDGALAPSDEWILVWEGARPGDTKELYRLYRRDFLVALRSCDSRVEMAVRQCEEDRSSSVPSSR
jgi:hypothetical protein